MMPLSHPRILVLDAGRSRVWASVVHADEELTIARHTWRLLERLLERLPHGRRA